MSDHDCNEMTWAKYRHDGDRKAFNKLISHYMPLVIGTARRFHRRTGLGDLGDLVEAGIWALWDSIEIYKIPQIIDFTKYARRTIRRKMINTIRANGTGNPN